MRVFEFGKTYGAVDGFDEKERLALYAMGNRNDAHWNQDTKKSDFFYLKGVITAIVKRLGINKIKEIPSKNPLYSEGISFVKNKEVLVDLGLVKKTISSSYDLKDEVFYSDINWKAMLELTRETKIRYQEIPKYPAVKRDFALLLDETVSFGEVYEIAFQTEKNLLEEVSLFDVYKGKNLPEGKKSYAISFTLQDPSKTLTDKQIDKIMSKLEAGYKNKLGASLR